MKSIKILAILLLLTAVVFIGCGGEEKEATDTAEGAPTDAPPASMAPPPMPEIEPGTAQAAYKEMADAVAALDAHTLYGLLSVAAQAQLDEMLSNMKKTAEFSGSPYAAVKNGEELLAKQFEMYKEQGTQGLDITYKDEGFLALALTECKVEGAKATIHEPSGGVLLLVKEEGSWKIDLPADTFTTVPKARSVPEGATRAS